MGGNMIRRFALWLAEWSDRWARRLHDDDAAVHLADVADSLDAWEVDCGTLHTHTLLQPFVLERRRAMSRHPAGKKRRT